jgi:glycosyltransferase involved in cell wall biosynthesis
MEFFLVTENTDFYLTDQNNLTLEIYLEAPGKATLNNIPAENIYFSPESILKWLMASLSQKNKQNICRVFSGNEKEYIANFLDEKNLFNNAWKAVSPGMKIKLALVFDFPPAPHPDFKTSLFQAINYFYNTLAGYYSQVQADLFTVQISKCLEYSAHIPVTNLFFLPATLAKIVSYDAVINISELLDKNNLFDLARLDFGLKKLAPTRESVNYKVSAPANDLVSIIIPTYNRENYLPQAISSVLVQTYKNIELIVVDDGSTDNTPEIAEKYTTDQRFTYIRQENQGISPARNTGIKNARGKYLMFLDDDDLYFPFAVEKLLNFIKRQPENVRLVYSEIIRFEGPAKIYKKGKFLPARPDLLLEFLTGCKIATPGQVIIEANAVREAGMFDSSFKNANDYELWTKIIYDHDIAKIETACCSYRLHESQVTRKMGVIRYFSDMVALKLWFRLKQDFDQLFKFEEANMAVKNKTIANNLEVLVKRMITSRFAHYDTGLELLKFAQEKHFSPDRRELAGFLQENIPRLIEEKYNSNLRVTDPEKKILKKQFKNPNLKINDQEK